MQCLNKILVAVCEKILNLEKSKIHKVVDF